MRGRPFAPGNQFGKGRPPGSRNKRTLLGDAIKEHGESLMKQCVVMAMKGNTAALRLCMDWLARQADTSPNGFRLPPVRTAEDIPAALQALTKAIARGKIAPQDAQAIANMLEKLLRVRATGSESPPPAEEKDLNFSQLTEEQLDLAEELRRAALEGEKESDR